MTREFEELMAHDRLDEAVERLCEAIAKEPENAELYFLRGRVQWRLDHRGEAISDYEHALAIDPDSPAGPALQLAREIMDFYNPDLLNP